jgi:hypothetical protein
LSFRVLGGGLLAVLPDLTTGNYRRYRRGLQVFDLEAGNVNFPERCNGFLLEMQRGSGRVATGLLLEMRRGDCLQSVVFLLQDLSLIQ